MEDSTCDFLTEDTKLSKQELSELFQIYRDGKITDQAAKLKKSLTDLIAEKAKFLEAKRPFLTTFVYIEEAIGLV